MASNAAPWDANGADYKCCCHFFHILTGARVIAIVEIACIGLVLLSDVIRLAAFDGSSISFTLNIIWVVIFCVVIALLFQAIKTENAILALPHLIYQVISIIFYIFLLLFAIIALANGSTWAMAAIGLSYDDTFYCPEMTDKSQCNQLNGYIDMESRLAGCLVLIVSFCLLIGFQLWVFFIVRKLYRYLSDKAKFAPNITSAAPYDGNMSRNQSFHIHRMYNIPSHHVVVVDPPPEYPMQLLQSYHGVDAHSHQLPILDLPPQQPTTINENKTSLATSEDASDAIQMDKKRDRNNSVRSLRTATDSSAISDSDEQ